MYMHNICIMCSLFCLSDCLQSQVSQIKAMLVNGYIEFAAVIFERHVEDCHFFTHLDRCGVFLFLFEMHPSTH